MGDRFDLAIWLEPEGPEQHNNTDLQVHLNFWKLPKYNIFDIGINLHLIKSGKVNIFINTKDEVSAFNIFSTVTPSNIANTIFNEFVSITTCPRESSCFKAERASDSDNPFCIFCLADRVRIEDMYNGKLITLDVSHPTCDNSICKCERLYIRLRLTGKGIDNLYVKEEIPASKFQYYTSRIDFLDFRLNNVRSLPESLLNYKNTYPKLQSVRCFLMVESSEELLLHNKSYKKVRAIEKEKWVPYIADLDLCNNKAILAYQWNTETIEQDFSLFTKIKRSEFNVKPCFMFIILTIILGIIPSVLAPYVDSFFRWAFMGLIGGE